MAHKKARWKFRNGRDSGGQEAGVKIYGGQAIKAGTIILEAERNKDIPGKMSGLAAITPSSLRSSTAV